MPKISKVYKQDWDFVKPLLDVYANGSGTDFKLLFNKYWQSDEEHLGYMLIESDVVVGFLGCVFSYRIIDNKINKFCGLSSWVVNPKYRSFSLYLLMEILKLKDYTITSFTSIPDAIKILTKLGFKILDDVNVYCPNKLFLPVNNLKMEIILNHEEIRKILDKNDLKIFKDHLQFKANHIVFKRDNDYCYMVFKEKLLLRRTLFNNKFIYILNRISLLFSKQGFIQKPVNVGRIHYISNLNFYNKYLQKINCDICKKYNLNGILVEKRFFKKKHIFCFNTMPKISLFKSSDTNPEDIDSMYTELFILDY